MSLVVLVFRNLWCVGVVKNSLCILMLVLCEWVVVDSLLLWVLMWWVWVVLVVWLVMDIFDIEVMVVSVLL